MTSHLDIRPLRLSDEPEWRRLWQAYLAFYETTLPEHIYALTFSRLLSNDPHEFSGFLAVLDGRPVGLAHFVFHRSSWFEHSVCYLEDLYADPDVRGQGIGRALIEAVYGQALGRGAPKVYWLTQEFNTTARTLYDRIAAKTPFLVYEKTF